MKVHYSPKWGPTPACLGSMGKMTVTSTTARNEVTCHPCLKAVERERDIDTSRETKNILRNL